MEINSSGELTGLECLCHLILVDEFETATITIPNPYNSNSVLNLFIHCSKKTKISAKLVNATPFIECNVFLSADIQSLDDNYDFSTQNAMNTVSDYANSYLEKIIASYLYKISKEYKSDIDNYGKYIIKNYSTWNEWRDSDWLNNFQNSFFSVHVDTNVQNGQLYTKI